MTAIVKKKRAAVQQKKIDAALKDAIDLFEQSEKPPVHAIMQKDIWEKHIRVFTKDKDAREVAFSLFCYSNLFYALESEELGSASQHNYEKLFNEDGTVNERLPVSLINKALVLKTKYDQLEHQARIEKELAFSQMPHTVSADIEQINALLLKVNEKLAEKGLAYSMQDTAAEGYDYMLEHLETKEKRSFKYSD